MNWKHENGYKVEGIIRGSERELYPIYIVKAQDGFAFVSPSYLDPWNSGHSAHLVKGVITEENPHNCVLKDDADGSTQLTISEMGTDEIKVLFGRFLAEYAGEPTYDFEGQHKRMEDQFALDIQK